MNITRRRALRQCLIITAGAAIMPSCLHDKAKTSVALKNLKLDGAEEKLLIELSETIIPATDTPGAKDTLTHLFVLRMLDDMYSQEEQQQFVKGMKAFDKLARTRLNKSFVNASPLKREELLSAIMEDKNKDASEDVMAFLKTMKKLTVQGYMSSRHYLTKVRVYELVPGRFHGCVPIASSNQKELQNNRKQPQI